MTDGDALGEGLGLVTTFGGGVGLREGDGEGLGSGDGAGAILASMDGRGLVTIASPATWAVGEGVVKEADLFAVPATVTPVYPRISPIVTINQLSLDPNFIGQYICSIYHVYIINCEEG